MSPTTLIILTIAKAIIFFGYVYFIYNRYGTLRSISASSYYLQGQERWYFFVFLAAIAILNIPQLGIWGFLSSAGLAFSGVTIDHRSTKANTKQVHVVGTAAGIIFAYLGLALLHGMLWPIFLFAGITAVLWFTTGRQFVWYMEIVAMSIALTAYFLRFL